MIKYALLFFLAILSTVVHAQFEAPDYKPDLWMINGQVNEVVRNGNTVYIGGSFSYVGPRTGSGVSVSTTTGEVNGQALQIQGEVFASAPDGSGGWYIGGNFDKVGNVNRKNFAHILPDQTLDLSWNVFANNIVKAIAVNGTTVYVGGDFTIIGGQFRNRIAALNATTGAVTSWNPGANETVLTLAVSGINVYAGGEFSNIGGQPRNYIAALDASTGAATTWNPNADGFVFTLAINGSNVYAGGQFSTIGGAVRSGIAALVATGTGGATTWNPNANGRVFAIAIHGPTVYVGGHFSNLGGQARQNIAALNITTGDASLSWNPGATGIVYALAATSTTLYVGGENLGIGGQSRSSVAALDLATGVVTSWNPGDNGKGYTLCVTGTSVFVGGSFSSMGGVLRNNIAALNATTGEATNWDPGANGGVTTIKFDGNTMFVGGAFSTIGGLTRRGLAVLDPIFGNATSWNANINGSVTDFAISGSLIYLIGNFSSVGGQPRNQIASVITTTGVVTSWDPDPSNSAQGTSLFAIAVSGSTVFVGGEFTRIGGQQRKCIAALDAITGNATSWNPNPSFITGSPRVHTLAVNGTNVYVGGWFDFIGGQSRSVVAALDVATGLATNWMPAVHSGVEAFAFSGNTVYIAGLFHRGTPVADVTAFDAITGNATGWKANVEDDFNVKALSISGTSVYIGGYFFKVGGIYRSNVAALSTATTCTPLDAPFITESGPVNIFPGGSVTLSAPTGFAYLWSTSETTQSITVSTPGSYTVQTITGTCTSAVSAAVVVTLIPPSPNVYVWNGTGDYNDPAFWATNIVPTGTIDSIIIASGTCTLNGSLNVERVRVEPSANLVVDGTVFTTHLNVAGMLVADRLEPTNGTGLGITTYLGSGSIRCSTYVKPAGDATIIHNTNLRANVLELGSEISLVGANAQLIIPYNPAGFHGISYFPGGSITQESPDQFSIEAYFDPATTLADGGAWFNVGPPIQHFPVNNLSLNNPFAANTYNNGVAAGSSLYLYNPNSTTWPTNQGYVKAPSAAYQLAPSEGVRVWLRTAKLNGGAVRFTGQPFFADQTFNLQYCPSGCSLGDPNGFNLIKNPFAAVLSWTNGNIIRTNMDNAFWIWNSDVEQFSSFAGGIGINGGREAVAIGQAFFVRANGPGASILLPTSATNVSTAADPFRAGAIDNLIKLKVMTGTRLKDEAAIRFYSTATAGYDTQYDAADMAGTTTGISTLLANGTAMGINVLPLISQTRVPIALTRIQANQNLTISLEGMDAGTQLWLNHSSFSAPITVFDGFSMPLTTVLATGLELIAMPTVTSLNKALSPMLTLRPNPANTNVQLHLTAGTLKQVTILDQLGRTVLSPTTLQGDVLDISTLAAGSYVVRVMTEGGVATQRLVVVR